ncbi:hypothetical protein C8J56DRAFT_889764 [Mycena floridula]|nr:hypothetical protein C8J56DRAFT_889764 [Mycena floridula]
MTDVVRPPWQSDSETPVNDSRTLCYHFWTVFKDSKFVIYSLHVPNLDGIEFRPKPALPGPTPGKIHVDDILLLLPARTVIVERAKSSRKGAEETLEMELGSLPKIMQCHLSARPTFSVASPGFQSNLTRHEPYQFDNSPALEPPSDDRKITNQYIATSESAVSFGPVQAATDSFGPPARDKSDEIRATTMNIGATAPPSKRRHNSLIMPPVREAHWRESEEFRNEQELVNQVTGTGLTSRRNLSPRRQRSNSSPEPPIRTPDTRRPNGEQRYEYRRTMDPPTTPYIAARHGEELEEGEIVELRDMGDDDPLGYLETSVEPMPRIQDATLAQPVPIPTQYPSIWEAQPAQAIPSLQQTSPMILVNAVIAHEAINIARPPKPTLPPLKRKASQVDNPESGSSSSSSANMVLGASIKSIPGASGSSAPGRFAQITEFTGILDFQLQETKGRILSSSLSSVTNEQNIPNMSHPLQIVLPVKGNEIMERETYQRPTKDLRISIGDGNDAGDERSNEESDEDREIDKRREDDVMREFFFIHDWRSWLSDKDIAAELVSHSSLSPRSATGTAGSGPPSTNATNDDMDSEVDDCSSQDSDSVPAVNGRDRPRTPFSTNDSDQQLVVHGEKVYSEMYYLHHMHQGHVSFPDNRLTPALQETTHFIHQPSSVRDPWGYHDHSQTSTRNITNPSPESIVEKPNPDELPRPGHPLSGNGRVRKVIVSRKSSLNSYPPHLSDYRLRIGQNAELEPGELKRSIEDVIRSCGYIKRMMSKVWLDADDYHMLDGTMRELRKMQEKDADDYYDLLDANRLEETAFVDEIPLVDEPNAFRLPPPFRHELVEFEVPVNADIAEVIHDLSEQVEVYLEREVEPRQMFRNVAFSPTFIHESPHVYTMYLCRQIRSDIHRTVNLTSRLISRQPFRDVLNRVPEDNALKHYFRYHCAFFRILEKDVLMELQGFNIECLHQQSPITQYHLPTERHRPRNPLLLPEEDEFFFHAATLFDHFQLFDAANALREIRGKHVMRPKDICMLLKHGYLDSVDHFDHFGQRLWARVHHDRS